MIPDPLRVLYERERGGTRLPEPLARWFGGSFSIPERADRPYVVANFVQALDGVVTFGPGANPLFGEPHDRMVMSLLRAWSDAVVVGRNTLLADPRPATWHWKTTAPAEARPWFAELARNRPRPHLELFVSGSGATLDFGRAVFRDPEIEAVVVTTRDGEPRARALLEASAPARAQIWALGAAGRGVDLAAVLARLREMGRRRVLSEGGPALHGSLESAGLLDELWLSHRSLVGGTSPARPTFSGAAHPADRAPALDLLSVRLAERSSTLFTRWRYRRP